MATCSPATMLTDYALALLCLYFAIATAKPRAGGGRSTLWPLAFLVTAFAAIVGGTAHGFQGRPLGDSRAGVWALTVFSIALGSTLLIGAGVHSALRPLARSDKARREGISWLKRAIVLSVAGLAALIGQLSLHEHFNHADLFHVIQMAGLYCLFRGALLLRGLVSESGSSRETSR